MLAIILRFRSVGDPRRRISTRWRLWEDHATARRGSEGVEGYGSTRGLTRGEGEVAGEERRATANYCRIPPTEGKRSLARKRGVLSAKRRWLSIAESVETWMGDDGL